MTMMDFALDDIPIATACFMAVSSSSKTADFVFTACNHAFIVLFGTDLSGMPFSRIPDKFMGLFNDVAKNAHLKTPRFTYGGFGSKRYDIRLSVSDSRYTVCIIESNVKDNLVERQLRLAIKSISTGIITANPCGEVSYINPAACRLTGWGSEAIGTPLLRVLDLHLENSLRPIDAFSQDEYQKLLETYSGSVVLKSRNGKAVDVSLNIAPVESPDGSNSCVVFFSDASKQRQREKEVTYLSYHDKLTGLFNRAYFEKKLKEFDNDCHYPVSIIMGDVNGLKMTNDIFGHRQGDMLLVTIANILSIACRESDIAARYGGDEFVVLMPNTTIDGAAKVCKNILNLCDSQTCEQSKVSVSLGYSCKSLCTESMNDTLNIAENFMYRHKLLESKSYRSSLISSLKNMLFEKSFETEEHAMRITGLCAKMGKLMGLSQSDLNDLELFAMLHDIGKIGIKDQVLLKPGKLTENEWTEMRKHCEKGYRIAQSTPELSHVADYILCHHERWDGTGYPQGLKGTQIPLLSRILSVADSYDAMVNDRYYRKALSHENAIAEIKRCSGTQFDPKIVKAFLKILDNDKAELSVSSA
jgi:diguanylate cyclase (GGDEF)-like protein/PAS domain S-box-containing protein